MLSKSIFGKGLGVLMATFGTPEHMTEAKNQDIWYEIFKDASDKDFMDGIAFCVDNCKFFPKPSDIKEVYRNKGCPDESEAWIVVKDYTYNKHERDVLNLPPILQKVINAMGGMYYLKSRNWEDEEKYIRRDFTSTYKDILQSAARDPEYLKFVDGNSLTNTDRGAKHIGSILGDQNKHIGTADLPLTDDEKKQNLITQLMKERGEEVMEEINNSGS